MNRNWDLPWHQFVETLQPHERPMMPGSPATPEHPGRLRAAYAAVGVLVALTGGLGNAMVTANVQNLAGDLGITTTDAAWLPVIFVMTNACMNLLLIKFRQQYGLRLPAAPLGLCTGGEIARAHSRRGSTAVRVPPLL